ncbi:Vacuolar protein sorting-associated protein 13, partial [Coemansia sp. RSA 2618]
MHGLFEAARQAAAYGTTQLTEEMIGSGNKYHFDVVMSAPVITFPRDGIVPYSGSPGSGSGGGSSSSNPLGVDVIVAQPGELTISNEFTTVREAGRDWDVNHISLALRRIGLKSEFVISEDTSEHGSFGQPGEQVLQMLEDVDYKMDMHMLMQGHIGGCPRPVTELVGMLSPVKLKLTEYQYKMVYDLLMMIVRVFGNDPNVPTPPDPLIGDRLLDLEILRENPATRAAKDTRQALANLRQIDEAQDSALLSEEQRAGQYATIDLFVTLATIQLELFQGSGFDLDSMRKASFTRMDINDLSVKYRAKANGDSKAEMAIVAVRAYDTRPGTDNQFTQIISPTIMSQSGSGRSESEPAAATATPETSPDAQSRGSMHAIAQDSPVEEDSGSPQLVCHVDMRPNQDMVVLLTLDSPRIILVLDHVFMLMGFAASAFPQQPPPPPPSAVQLKDTAQATDARAAETTGGLIYKVDILHPELILLANPSSRASEALILSVNQIILAQEGLFCATMDEIGVSLCTIDRRQETSRNVMDPFTVIATMDSRVTASGGQTSQISDVSVDVGNLLLRLGLNDVLLMLEIFNKAMELMYRDGSGAETGQQPSTPAADAGLRSNSAHPQGRAWDSSETASVASAPSVLRQDGGGSEHSSPDMAAAAAAAAAAGRIIKETMRVTVASLRVVVIRDMFGLPVYACTAREFHVDATDWSLGLQVRSNVQLQASYFNRRNSHWEPVIEPWRFAVNMASEGDVQRVDISAADRLLVNASHALIEETLCVAAQWDDEVAKRAQGGTAAGERMPYVLVNRTGIDCHVWVDVAEGAAARAPRIDTSPVLLRDGESLPWRFEDWRRRREQLEATAHHVGIQFANGQWEWLRRVQVDREGVRYYTLQPAADGIHHRVAVEVRLDAANLVKRVELRSPLVVVNSTRVAMEVAMCDYRGELRTDAAVIAPGAELPLPILFCHQYAVRVRPEGFGYAWSSQYIYWRDFLAQDARTELCCLPGTSSDNAGASYGGGRNTHAGPDVAPDAMPFFVHFNALCDVSNPALYKYPFMRLVMTPPLEIENLLPYALQVCVIDKTVGRKWISGLARGGVAAVHAVQPGHLVLLTMRIPDAGFDQCDGTIIETSDEDEYPVDDTIS